MQQKGFLKSNSKPDQGGEPDGEAAAKPGGSVAKLPGEDFN